MHTDLVTERLFFKEKEGNGLCCGCHVKAHRRRSDCFDLLDNMSMRGSQAMHARYSEAC